MVLLTFHRRNPCKIYSKYVVRRKIHDEIKQRYTQIIEPLGTTEKKVSTIANTTKAIQTEKAPVCEIPIISQVLSKKLNGE